MSTNPSPNQLSFLPDDYLARKAQRRTNTLCAILFGAFLVGVGVTFFFNSRTTRALAQREAGVEVEYNQAALRIQQVQRMQEKQKRMARQAELTASLLEKVPRSYLLAEYTNALPAGVSLLDFKLTSVMRQQPVVATTKFEQNQIKAAPVEVQPKIYDVKMQLTGLAYSDVQVAQYIGKLSESQLLQQVSLKVVEEHVVDKKKLRQFQLEMTLRPNAEVQPDTKDTRTASIPMN